MVTDTVLNGLSHNYQIGCLYFCYKSIFVFENKCLGYSNTSHINSSNRFRKSVIYKVLKRIDHIINKERYEEEKFKLYY